MKLVTNLFPLSSALLCVGAIVFLQGCSSSGDKHPEYLDAYSLESLEIPPKLTTPDTSGALRLPEPAKKADCN